MTTSPITITDTARDHIQNFLKTMGENAGFKLGVKASGCSGFAYVVDIAQQPGENDECIDINNVRVFIDKDSIPMLKGTMVDLKDKGIGQKQLCFNNPNVEDSCGCGESFTVKSED